MWIDYKILDNQLLLMCFNGTRLLSHCGFSVFFLKHTEIKLWVLVHNYCNSEMPQNKNSTKTSVHAVWKHKLQEHKWLVEQAKASSHHGGVSAVGYSCSSSLFVKRAFVWSTATKKDSLKLCFTICNKMEKRKEKPTKSSSRLCGRKLLAVNFECWELSH